MTGKTLIKLYDINIIDPLDSIRLCSLYMILYNLEVNVFDKENDVNIFLSI